jgi:tetratricopeptide (TPR) repeat protein
MVIRPYCDPLRRGSVQAPLRGALVAFAVCLCSCVHGPLEKGEDCLLIGDYQNAILFFQKSVEDDPGSFRPRRGLALSLLQKCSALESEDAATAEEWKSAARAARYALRIHRDSALQFQQATAEFNAAKRFEARGDTTAALQSALQAVVLQPRETRAINYAAVLSYRTGNTKAATDLFLQATLIDSSDAVAFYDIGMLHWYSHDILRAYDWFLKALKRSPSDTVIVYWVARAESELKRLAGKK